MSQSLSTKAVQVHWGFGKTPIHTILDALPLAKEKLTAA
jgi:hypothetical protein